MVTGLPDVLDGDSSMWTPELRGRKSRPEQETSVRIASHVEARTRRPGRRDEPGVFVSLFFHAYDLRR
jgi:hypothetical protein